MPNLIIRFGTCNLGLRVRVPNRLLGIRDSAYLEAGIREFKEEGSEMRDHERDRGIGHFEG